MLAEYTVSADWWTDMPEAQPRARARVKNKKPDAQVVILDDGSLVYDVGADVEIDYYQSPKYKDVRDEERRSVPIETFADRRITPVVGKDKPPKKPDVHTDRPGSQP